MPFVFYWPRNLLPVLDRANGELTGIVTRNDVLRAQTKQTEYFQNVSFLIDRLSKPFER